VKREAVIAGLASEGLALILGSADNSAAAVDPSLLLFPTLWYSTRSRFFFLVGFVNLRKSLTEILRNACGMVRAKLFFRANLLYVPNIKM